MKVITRSILIGCVVGVIVGVVMSLVSKAMGLDSVTTVASVGGVAGSISAVLSSQAALKSANKKE